MYTYKKRPRKSFAIDFFSERDTIQIRLGSFPNALFSSETVFWYIKKSTSEWPSLLAFWKNGKKRKSSAHFITMGKIQNFPIQTQLRGHCFFFGTYSKNMPNSALLEYFIKHKPPPIVLYPKATYFGTFLIFENKKNSKY